MTAYDKASLVAKNKASVFYRMATLWLAAKQYKKAEENINKALNTDATYAPAYKAQADFNRIFQRHEETTKSLVNYTKYADEDTSTALEIAKLYFITVSYTHLDVYKRQHLFLSKLILHKLQLLNQSHLV